MDNMSIESNVLATDDPSSQSANGDPSRSVNGEGVSIGTDVFEDIDNHLPILGFLQQVLRQPPSSLEGLKASDLEDADRDFRRLLEGPEKPLCPPWESAFKSEDDLLFQRETIEVRNFYLSRGMQIDVECREPEDHMAFELAFCSLLLATMREAGQAGDYERAQSVLDDLRRFYSEHLGKWGEPWANQLAEKASSDYYREVAHMLQDELRWLGQQ